MLVEQFLHIMLNQDNPRFLCFFFRPQKYIFLHYAILWEMENMRKNLYKRLQSHRLNPLNNARFPMSYAVLNICLQYFLTRHREFWRKEQLALSTRHPPDDKSHLFLQSLRISLKGQSDTLLLSIKKCGNHNFSVLYKF